jgi:hypothetical protein
MLLLLLLWLALFAVLLGWGLLAQSAIRGASRGAIHGALTTFQTMWLGYAALLLFLLVYSLVLPITRLSIPLVTMPAIAGLYLQRRVVMRRSLALRMNARTSTVIGVVIFVAALLVSYAACDRVTWYDTDLYHLQVVKWNATYPAVPGLANLHMRFGDDSSVHVFAAFVDAFWEGEAVHAMNGFFLAAVLAQWASEVFTARTPRGRLRQTYCLLTLPFLLQKLWTIEVASLSTDLPLAIYGLVLVLELLSLPRARRERLLLSLLLILALATVAVTTKLGGLAFLAVASVAVLGLIWRGIRARTSLVLLGAPALVLVVWLVRNAIVSGWLLFPVFGRLPLPWSVPQNIAENHLRWIQSWARLPQQMPDDVLGHGFFHWFRPWFELFRQTHEMILLGFAAALLAFRAAQRPLRSAASRAGQWAAFAACAFGVLQWFVGAPELRFGAYLMWMLPVVLFAPMVAGAMREQTGRAFVIALALIGCAWSGGLSPRVNAVVPKLVGRPPAPTKANVVWAETGPGTRVLTPKAPEPKTDQPPQPPDDRCGDAALPCTPYPGTQTLRDTHDLGAGFYPAPPDQKR